MSFLHLAFAASLLVLSASVGGQANSPTPQKAPAFAQGIRAQTIPAGSPVLLDALRPSPAMNAVPRLLPPSAAEVGHDAPKVPSYVCGMPVISVDAGIDPRIVAPLSDEARRAHIRVIKPECDDR